MPDINIQETVPEAAFRSRSGTINELAGALAKAQGEMHGAKKDSVNPHFKSNYADLGSVLDAIREPFAKNGLAVTQWLRTVQNGVEVETILMHSSGQFMSDILSIPTGKFDAHGIGSAATYCRRYALMAAVGIAPVDDDGNDAVVGAPGTAGAGTQFRPERRAPTGSGPMKQFAPDAQRDGLVDTTRPKGALPAKPAATNDALTKRMEWIKKSVDALKSMNAPAAKTWWKAEADRIGVIETALPTEYERLLDAYNEACERPVELA